MRDSVVAATERLIETYNPEWEYGGRGGIHPAWLEDASGAGFRDIETFSFDVAVPYSHEAWRGRVRASAGIGASLPPEAVAEFDAEHARVLAERFPEQPQAAPHRVFAILATKP